jgi:hypothetical protein
MQDKTYFKMKAHTTSKVQRTDTEFKSKGRLKREQLRDAERTERAESTVNQQPKQNKYQQAPTSSNGTTRSIDPTVTKTTVKQRELIKYNIEQSKLAREGSGFLAYAKIEKIYTVGKYDDAKKFYARKKADENFKKHNDLTAQQKAYNKKGYFDIKGDIKRAVNNKVEEKKKEYEQDNLGYEAYNKVEKPAVKGSKKLYRWGKKRVQTRPYRQQQKEIRKQNEQLIKEYRGKGKIRNKLYQRRKLMQARIVSIYRNAGGTPGKFVGFILKKVVKNIIPSRWIIIAGAIYIAIHMIITQMGSFFMQMLFTALTTTAVSMYVQEDEDLDQVAKYITQLDTDFYLDVQDTSDITGVYDEINVNVLPGEIQTAQLPLFSYLNVTYEDYTFNKVKDKIRDIHGSLYREIKTATTEVRYRPVTSYDPVTGAEILTDEPYDYKILDIYVNSTPITEWIAAQFAPQPSEDEKAAAERVDRKEWYEVLTETGGGRQLISSPFDKSIDWRNNLTTYYGYRINPLNGSKELHEAVDIAMPQGTPILAGVSGTITTGYDSVLGNYVKLTNDSLGTVTTYAHCDTVSVTNGQIINRGDILGTVGNTGQSTGTHLHLAIEVDGKPQNPLLAVDYS